MSGVPSLQHYRFAHLFLPRLAAEDPEGTFSRLTGPDARGYLLAVWAQAGTHVSPDKHVSPEGLGSRAVRLSGRVSVAIVTLPPPRAITEAHFVALAIWPGRRTTWLERLPIEHRYYTLERGEADAGSPTTVFCEWKGTHDGKGTHVNYGRGPTPTDGAFLQTIDARISGFEVPAIQGPQPTAPPGAFLTPKLTCSKCGGRNFNWARKCDHCGVRFQPPPGAPPKPAEPQSMRAPARTGPPAGGKPPSLPVPGNFYSIEFFVELNLQGKVHFGHPCFCVLTPTGPKWGAKSDWMWPDPAKPRARWIDDETAGFMGRTLLKPEDALGAEGKIGDMHLRFERVLDAGKNVIVYALHCPEKNLRLAYGFDRAIFAPSSSERTEPRDTSPTVTAETRLDPLARPPSPDATATIHTSWNGARFAVGDLVQGTLRVESVLAGGMGTVFICRRLTAEEVPATPGAAKSRYFEGSLERRLVDHSPRVALKTIRRDLQGRGQRLESFLREASLWIGLPPHPNIVRAFEWRDGVLHLEYINGGDLRKRLRNGPIPIGDVIRISLEFCRGMQFLYATAGIIHRDIKPENILLTASGSIKITDFGIARALTADPAQQNAGLPAAFGKLPWRDGQSIVGTLPYMSPEQHLGARDLSTRSDIYAFGVVLYEMICGHRPFETREVLELRRMHLEDVPASPVAVLPTADPELSAIAMKCLEKMPERRFADFGELGDAVETLSRAAGQHPPAVSSPILSDLETGMGAVDWCLRARVLGFRGDAAGALLAATRARDADRQLSGPGVEMAVALLAQNRTDDAVGCLRAEQRQFPDNSDPHIVEALMHYHSRRFAEALVAAQKAVALSPDTRRPWLELIRCAAAANQSKEITRGGVQLLLLHTLRSHMNLSECIFDARAMAMGRQDLIANQLHGHAVLKFPLSPMAWFNWGVTCHRIGLLDHALQYYSKAIALDGASTEAWINRGWVHVDRKEFGQAVNDFRTANEVGRDNDFAGGLLEGVARSLSNETPPAPDVLKSWQFLRDLTLDYYL